VGRVQTPTLALIVQRDTTIENFKSIPFHTIKAGFSHANGAFVAAWKPCEDQPGLDNEGRLTDTKIADAIVAQFTKKQGVIAEYKQEPKKQNQPLAFALSDITALASSKFGYSAEDVLKTCQSLYETHKLTSYPRTDCAYLPESQHADAKAVLAALKTVNPDLAGLIDGANPSIKSPTWNDAKITAHHGIIPTMHTGSKSGLNEKERNIYELIVRAYIAQFYPAHEYLSTKIAVEVEGESFTATGKTVTKNGWKDVFEQQDDDDKKEDSQTIPVMRQHDSVLCQQGKRFDQQTKPPARFTEGTLIRAMESIHKFIDDPEQKKILRDGDGIGTSATRATIIADLKRRGFVEAKGKAVISTPLGRELIAALPSQVKSAAMTAIYERILKQIEEQKADLEDFCQKQAEFVRGQVEKANAGALHLAQHNPPAGKKPAYKTRPIKRKKT
jgi:DNA topoisomerase-3